MPTLGQQLKALRVKNGMTQEQLAEKLNTTKAAISRYERDQRQPRLEQISEIAHILGANPDELFGLFYRSKDVQDEDGDKGAAYLSALLKWAQTVMPEAAQETNDDDLEDWLDDDNSPFDIYYADEKDVVQRLLDIFLKLDRGWQKELIEDAEMYLDFQEKRKEKEQRLEQKG